MNQYGSIAGLSDAVTKLETQLNQEKEFSEKASSYQQQAAEYQNTLNFDVEAAEEEVAQLQALLDYYETIKRPTDTPETVAFVQKYGRPDKIAQTVNEKKAIIENAKQTQEFYRLSSVSDPDSEYYDATWNQDRKTALDSMEERKWLYNGLEFNYMTDEERAIFEYQLAVNGQEAAQKYLAGIKENLSYRHGKDISGDVSKFGPLGEVFYMGYAGLDNWAQGVQSSFEALTGQGGKKTTTATQYAAGITRENLGDRGKLWQLAGDISQNLGNVAPSLLLGSINPLAGYATTLVGAGGNGYQEAINMGYSDGQAKFYGVLTGASEVLLEKLLNGVGNYGGALTGHAMEKLISNIHKAIVAKIKATFSSQKARDAASQEAFGKDLAPVEKALKLWEEAYAEGQKAVKNAPVQETVNKNTATNGGVKYSFAETTDGRFVAVIDNDILGDIDTRNWDNEKKHAAKEAAKNALKKFKGGIVVNGITHKVNRTSRREYTGSQYTEALYSHDDEAFADKMRAADIVDDIVIVATNWQRDGKLTHERKDNIVDFDHGKTLILSGEKKYSAEVLIGITNSGEAVFFDVVGLTPTKFEILKKESPTTATTHNAIGDILGDSNGKTISQPIPNVKNSVAGTEDILTEAEEQAAAKQATQARLNYLRKQVAITKEKTADPKSVDKIAGKLVRQWGADMEAGDISQDLQVLYDHILRVSEVDLWEEATSIGRKIAENITLVEGDIFAEYGEMRKELRDMHIYVSPEVVADIPDYFDTVRPYRNRLKLTTKQSSGAMGIDQAFQVLSNAYPEFFSEDSVSVPSDQLQRLLEVTDTIYAHGVSRFLEA